MKNTIKRLIDRQPKLVLLAVAVVFLLAFMAYFFILNKASLTVKVTPVDAKVTLNNAPLTITKGEANIKTTPGIYTLTVEANNYVPYHEKLTLKKSRAVTRQLDLKVLPSTGLLETNITQFMPYDGESVGYLGNSGATLYTATAELTSEGFISGYSRKPMTPDALAGVSGITFSPDRQLALMHKGSDLYLYDFNRYDIIHQEMRLIGQNIGDAVWSPDQSRIIYYQESDNSSGLFMADPLNSSPTRLVTLTDVDNPELVWSKSGDYLLIIPHNSDSNKNKLYRLDIYLKELTALTDSGGVIGAKFINDDKNIIYFVADTEANNPIKSTAWIMDQNGASKTNLNVRSTPGGVYKIDENKLIFLTYANGRQRVIKVDLEARTMAEIFFTRSSDFEVKNLFYSTKDGILYLESNNNLYAVKYQDDRY